MDSQDMEHTAANIEAIGPALPDCTYFTTHVKAGNYFNRIIWQYEGANLRRWVHCKDLEREIAEYVTNYVDEKYIIGQLIPVGNNKYAVQCVQQAVIVKWIIYEKTTKKARRAFSAHRNHRQYALNNCLVINNFYYDLNTWKRYELESGHTITHYSEDGGTVITFKQLPYQLSDMCQYYCNGVPYKLGWIVCGDGQTIIEHSRYTYRFVMYYGEPGEHLPHFSLGYAPGCIHVFGDLILIGSSREYFIVDNPLCVDYSIKLVWRTENYQLLRVYRINSGKRTKIAKHISSDDDTAACEAD